MFEKGPFLFGLLAMVFLGFGIIQDAAYAECKPGQQCRQNVPIQTKEDCEKLGGSWGRFGFIQKDLCNYPTQDAGKTCSDSSECESVCTSDKKPSAWYLFKGDKEQGTCFGWSVTLGTCIRYVRQGKIDSSLLCVD